MIDMKQLLADREAGTQGPFFVGKNNPTSIYTQHGVFLAKTHSDYSREYMAETDARRFARVPELEKALIDARAALEKTIAQLDIEHADYMLGKGRDPAKYVSQWSRAADSIRATLKGLGE